MKLQIEPFRETDPSHLVPAYHLVSVGSRRLKETQANGLKGTPGGIPRGKTCWQEGDTDV